MEYIIKNEQLTVAISDMGAELQSIKSADGTEYLWQADPAVWNGKAPNLFPYIARLNEGKCTINGDEYSMKIHGFLMYMVLSVDEQKEDSITFRLDANEETKKQYPFDFVYRITYTLKENQLWTTTTVENCGTERMYFAVGGHPGFNVPLEEGLTFEDYYLEFAQESHPSRVVFSEKRLISGVFEPYALEEDRRISLHHDLFDSDAIVLKNAARSVRIASDKGSRSVVVNYPDFANIGFWHMPKLEAPYVCIEPWSSLPSRDGITEEFSQQSDLIHLNAGKTYENIWTITIC